MKRLLAIIASIACVTSFAQTSPGFLTGQIPTAEQWNSYFAGKQDYLSGGYPANAGLLTGTTLAAGVTGSSLTSVGALGNLTVTNPIAGSVTGSAGSFTGSLSGDVTGTQGATAIAASTVTGKALTGFSASAGTVSATDSVLTAFNKIVGNIGNLISSVITGPGSSTAGNIPLWGNGTGTLLSQGISVTSVSYPGSTYYIPSVAAGAAVNLYNASASAGSIPYNTGPEGTAFLAPPPTSSLYMAYNATTGAPYWTTAIPFTSNVSSSGNTYTATFSPAFTVLGASQNGTEIVVSGLSANTGSATLNVNVVGAIPIVKGPNTPLIAGDIAGASHQLLLIYNSSLGTGGSWELLNPTVGQLATSLNGFTTNCIPYQSAAGVTACLTAGTGVVQETSSGAPVLTNAPAISGSNISGGTAAINITGSSASSAFSTQTDILYNGYLNGNVGSIGAGTVQGIALPQTSVATAAGQYLSLTNAGNPSAPTNGTADWSYPLGIAITNTAPYSTPKAGNYIPQSTSTTAYQWAPNLVASSPYSLISGTAITSSANSVTVTGSGTTFVGHVTVGDTVAANGIVLCPVTVVAATTLTMGSSCTHSTISSGSTAYVMGTEIPAMPAVGNYAGDIAIGDSNANGGSNNMAVNIGNNTTSYGAQSTGGGCTAIGPLAHCTGTGSVVISGASAGASDGGTSGFFASGILSLGNFYSSGLTTVIKSGSSNNTTEIAGNSGSAAALVIDTGGLLSANLQLGATGSVGNDVASFINSAQTNTSGTGSGDGVAHTYRTTLFGQTTSSASNTAYADGSSNNCSSCYPPITLVAHEVTGFRIRAVAHDITIPANNAVFDTLSTGIAYSATLGGTPTVTCPIFQSIVSTAGTWTGAAITCTAVAGGVTISVQGPTSGTDTINWVLSLETVSDTN